MTTRPQDFFPQSPKSVLNKPFMHVQDQKAYNADGGNPTADAWTKHDLTNVLYNDIVGATLVGNSLNLPAGTYFFEGVFLCRYPSGSATCIAGLFKDGALVLRGLSHYVQSNASMPVFVSGVMTLSVPGVVDLKYYVGVSEAASTGLGLSNSTGSIADNTLLSVYGDLKIWQLDRSLEIAPVAVNPGLQTMAGVETEGNIQGCDVSVAGNVVTLTKGALLASDGVTPLAVTVDTPITLPGTINQNFFLFMVRLVSNGTWTYKAYTTLAGPASDVLIDKWRRVSYAQNDGAGVTMPFKQVGDEYEWTTAAMPQITASLTTSFVSYGVDSVLPNIVCRRLLLAIDPNVGGSVSYDGVNTVAGNSSISGSPTIVPVSSIYLKTAGTSGYVKIRGFKMRR